ncbi:hypothetical protein ACQPZF_01430 [Actinosynnema sp. CS-041913]|uniref:hypothetical protein n=1 Tax=Actinosynnema sp. CS-041913 TaxID=3239917 RepID=UPI003D8C80AC
MKDHADNTTTIARQEVTIECTDALGRRRELAVSATASGLSFRTPPGESASLDWFEVDQLHRALAELRQNTPANG